MSTALDTLRKFGDDCAVRVRALDLIERGLWSIRDVVGAVLAINRMPPDARRLSPADLDDLRVLIEREIARRQLHLSWQSGIESEVAVAATETRQVALNLLLNACEVSPPGGEIGFRASIDDGCGGLPELNLEVSDSGPGLPPDIVATLSGDRVMGTHDPAHWIGLRVICDLVQGLGGRIVATTLEFGGSRITVTLPIDDSAEQVRAA